MHTCIAVMGRRIMRPTSLSDLASKVDPSDHGGSAASFLREPHVRKHVLKLVYAEEWWVWNPNGQCSARALPGWCSGTQAYVQRVASVARTMLAKMRLFRG